MEVGLRQIALVRTLSTIISQSHFFWDVKMGYTHYWYRPKEIPEDKFHAIVVDFKKLLPLFRRRGIKLAGGLGTGRPKVNDPEVVFNGSRFCGHPKNGISIPFYVAFDSQHNERVSS
jgi:hypothetical protein